MDPVKPSAWKKRGVDIAISLLLAGIIFAVYYSTIGYDFLSTWDDQLYIIENRLIQSFSWANVRKVFEKVYFGNYAPLHLVSYMLDHSLWGLNAAGFHLTNIILHIANGILVYFLSLKFTQSRFPSFIAAFIFLAHPVQVESVAWLSERKNVLAMFFFLVSLICHIRHTERASGKRSLLYYAVSLLAFLCALLSKSVVVILPAILILYDFLLLPSDRARRLLISKIPYAALAIAFAVIAVVSQSPELEGGRTEYHGGSIFTTFLTMLPVFVRYLMLLFWPLKLSALYDPPIKTALDLQVIASFILLAAVLATLYPLYRKNRPLCFWLAFFLIGFVPVSQIVPINTLMQDRYLYFPIVGLSAFVATGFSHLMGKASAPWAKTALIALLCILLTPLPFLSFQRTKVWKSSLTLWNDARKKYPESTRVWTGFGVAYQKIGRQKSAVAAYQKALYYEPDNFVALTNLGIIFNDLGEYETARRYIMRLIGKYPNNPAGFLTLGNGYHLEGKIDLAESAYHQALRIDPDFDLALLALGSIYLDKRDFAKARWYFKRAQDSGGDQVVVEIEYRFACLESMGGNIPLALKHLEKAFQSGYRDLGQLLNDPFLASVRSDRGFQSLVKKYFDNSLQPVN